MKIRNCLQCLFHPRKPGIDGGAMRSDANNHNLQQAKSQYLGTLSIIPGLQVLLIQIRNTLATLLTRPPGEMPGLTPGEAEIPKISLVVLQDIPTSLLMRRPEIRVAAWQVATQSAQIGIAEADFYPSVSLLVSIGYSGASEDSIPDSGLLTVGPGLTWNLFDHGRITTRVKGTEEFSLTVFTDKQSSSEENSSVPFTTFTVVNGT